MGHERERKGKHTKWIHTLEKYSQCLPCEVQERFGEGIGNMFIGVFPLPTQLELLICSHSLIIIFAPFLCFIFYKSSLKEQTDKNFGFKKKIKIYTGKHTSFFASLPTRLLRLDTKQLHFNRNFMM